jgi:release factor glutamine methyltransferase
VVEPDPEVVIRLRAAGCVAAEEEAALLTAAARRAGQDLAPLVDRRVSGVPLEVVLGRAAFMGLEVAVTSGVFVPRRRSEHLVREALRHVRHGDVVVDLCCGTGAIGLAVASQVEIELHAVDVDEAAVGCAARNLEGVRGTAYVGDLDGPLPALLRGHVDVLLASPPYVPSGEVALLPREAREHEPLRALDGGADGLDLVRRIAGAAERLLAPSGAVVVETGQEQAGTAAAAFAEQGLVARSSATEEAAVVVARRPGSGQMPIGLPATDATSSGSPSSTTSACSLRP